MTEATRRHSNMMESSVAFRDTRKLWRQGAERRVGEGRGAACLSACRWGCVRGRGKAGEAGCPACCPPDPFHVGGNNGLRRRQEKGRPQVCLKGDTGALWNAEVNLKRAGEGLVLPSARPLL